MEEYRRKEPESHALLVVSDPERHMSRKHRVSTTTCELSDFPGKRQRDRWSSGAAEEMAAAVIGAAAAKPLVSCRSRDFRCGEIIRFLPHTKCGPKTRR